MGVGAKPWPRATRTRAIVRMAGLMAAIMLCCLTLLARPARAQSAADVAAARELFIQGSELSKDGKWEQARDRFERSLALKRAPITLYSLGVAQMRTGQRVEALESFRAFLAEPTSETTEGYVEPARGAIEELERRVARLDIQIQPANAEGLVVSVDRQPVPSAALGIPRLVNAGDHVVRAEAPGYATRTVAVSVAEAETAPVVLVLSRDGASSDAPTSDEKTGSFPTGPVVLMVVGGVATGAGIAVGLVGVSEAGDAPSSDSSEADAARAKATAGDVVAALGIGTAIAGLLWLILDDGDDGAGAADARPASPGPAWRPRASAQGLTWSF